MSHPMSKLNRRRFLGTLATALLARPRLALTEVNDPRPPVIDTSNPVEVADGVWIVKDHRVWLVPNVAIVVGRDAALVFETGLGPENGARVLELARRLAGKRRLYLSVSHFHPEHGYGAQVFERQATIVYNRRQQEELIEKGAHYLELFRSTQSPAAKDALRDTRIVLPHQVYDGPSTHIDLGGRMVELHNQGTAHTRGDQILFLPKERILFSGDLIEERMFPIFPWFPPNDIDVDADRWRAALRGFERFAPRLLIPGHGDPGPVAIALDLAKQMDNIERHVADAIQSGIPSHELHTRLKPLILAENANWEHPELIDWQLNYFVDRYRAVEGRRNGSSQMH